MDYEDIGLQSPMTKWNGTTVKTYSLTLSVRKLAKVSSIYDMPFKKDQKPFKTVKKQVSKPGNFQNNCFCNWSS